VKIVTVAKMSPRKLGGFEQEMLLLSRELAARGDRHTIFFEGKVPAWFDEQLRGAGAKFQALAMSSPGDMWKLIGEVRREKADLAHLHFFRVMGMPGPALKLAGLPKVVLSERMGLGLAQRPILRQLAARVRAGLAQPFLARIICISQYVRERLIISDYARPEKLEVIYNGVDLAPATPGAAAACREKLGLAAGDSLVGAVAYAAPGKGVEIFVEAARRLSAKYPQVAFLHCGDGPLLEGLRAELRAEGLENRIRLLGHQREVRPWLAACDLVVVPSAAPEGLSFAAMEAMAESRPVVGTRAGGLAEVVADGETGLVVAPGNAAALAAGIERLLENPRLAEGFGPAGRRRAEEKFDLRRKVNETIALYERVVSG
jgi:glycosyltransferase involved in cell wall biosynthesis